MNVYMSKETWEGILNAVREKLEVDDYYKADEVAEKILEIGTRDTLTEFLNNDMSNVVYSGKALNDYAFYNNKYIKTFEALNLSAIFTYAFTNCSVLHSVRCENVTNITGSYVFQNCVALEEIYFPNCVKISSAACFDVCASLKKIELQRVSIIEGNAVCRNCTSLESVILMSCTSIVSTNTFQNCQSLKEVVIGTTNCTISNSSIFPSTLLEQGSIYVPDEAVETYKEATNWSALADIIKPMSEREVAE